MIFGFNTDVNAGGTVYHVQSEARIHDLLLQTQVFVKGQCIGKCATSYAERTVQAKFSNEEIHEWLKRQHKMMLDAVRQGTMTKLFCIDGEVQDIDGDGLALNWLNSTELFPGSVAVLKLRAADNGEPVEGALITSRLSIMRNAPIHSQSVTEADGIAELQLIFPEPPSKAETAVLVRATFNDKAVTRKIRIRRG